MIDSLRNGQRLSAIYNNAYMPSEKKQIVYDPVLGEKHQYGEPKKNNPMVG